ncbi:Uncharacterised protein [Mycobacteroides abscessus subsp. abscessus]|nr:Uncharacterised protein [Mycobacteroides abscessus subsp. abscessus]SKW07072.1 Uncharacterised protein [Mycobacteroides abscessus subsp. abscessus]
MVLMVMPRVPIRSACSAVHAESAALAAVVAPDRSRVPRVHRLMMAAPERR